MQSKYVFRPRLPILIENDHFDAPFQYEYNKICRECYSWDSEMSAIKTVWLVNLTWMLRRAIQYSTFCNLLRQIYYIVYFQGKIETTTTRES